MNKIIVLKNVFYHALIFILLCGSLIVIAGRFGFGGVRTLVVQSGSMEPHISIYSIIFLAPVTEYKIGDIVTYKQSGRDNVLITHRIYKESKITAYPGFITKGDANEKADQETVPESFIVGKVFLSIPYIGRLIAYTQTKAGFVILIIIPAVFIIYSEILSLKNQLINMYKKNRQDKLLYPLK